jgi:hypothetical protein
MILKRIVIDNKTFKKYKNGDNLLKSYPRMIYTTCYATTKHVKNVIMYHSPAYSLLYMIDIISMSIHRRI